MSCESLNEDYGDILREFGTVGEEFTSGDLNDANNAWQSGEISADEQEAAFQAWQQSCVVQPAESGGEIEVTDVEVTSPESGLIEGSANVRTDSSEVLTADVEISLDGSVVTTGEVATRDGAPDTVYFEIEDVSAGDHEVCVEVQ